MRDVRFAYPDGTTPLEGVTLALAPGERVALLGANGSGKTTLARLVLGLLTPTGGSVQVGPYNPAEASRSALASWVGLVFQNPDHQLFRESVWEEVAFGPTRVGQADVDRRVARTLARFGLQSFAQREPAALSGGERKRVALAATEALLPRVLLLDEPTKGTDYGRKQDLIAFGREVADAGRTVVFITHDTEFALEAAERAVVLHRGRVALDGPAPEVLGDPALEAMRIRPPATARLVHLLRAQGHPAPFTRLEDLRRWLGEGP